MTRVQKGDPENAREINKSLILNLLREVGEISRAEISRKLCLSKVTVSAIVSDLINMNLVFEVGPGASFEKGGRKPVMISLDPKSSLAIGIDIGRSNTAILLGNLKGEILYKDRTPTGDFHTPLEIAEMAIKRIDLLIKKTGVSRKRIIGLGISIGGMINKNEGKIIFSPDFHWENVNINEIFEEKTGFPVIIDNCTRAMTFAEKWYGAARNNSNLLYINIGHGIGSSMIIHNRIYNNHSEFGHTYITGKDVVCECGKKGCLEAIASGKAIEQKIHENGFNLSGIEAAKLAREGNEQIRNIYTDAGNYIGQAIAGAVNLINPEKIIIGGGVSLAGDLIIDSINNAFQKHVLSIFIEETSLEVSDLGLDAASLGAMALVLDNKVFKTNIINK